MLKNRQLKKGVLELAVLGILFIKPCYGYDIAEILKSNQLTQSEGTVYPLLMRLKKEELITYRWEESTKGPPRKYYELTKSGKAHFTELIEEYHKIHEGLQTILGGKL